MYSLATRYQKENIIFFPDTKAQYTMNTQDLPASLLHLYPAAKAEAKSVISILRLCKGRWYWKCTVALISFCVCIVNSCVRVKQRQMKDNADLSFNKTSLEGMSNGIL